MKSIILKHNLDPKQFMWLWAKYVKGFKSQYHCTNCLAGKYSEKFSGKKSPDLFKEGEMILDEVDDFEAIYLCGVIKKGYAQKKNYPHNFHAAILPQTKKKDTLVFENWSLNIENGIFLPIPEESELPEQYTSLEKEYTTCRIFRWGACYFDAKEK